jgi:hypothetical protein
LGENLRELLGRKRIEKLKKVKTERGKKLRVGKICTIERMTERY